MSPFGGRVVVISTPEGTASKPSDPQRTCVGCRLKSSRTTLLRIVAVQGVATPDPRRRLPGRGANVHPTAECVALAIRRKSLPRALRVGRLDTEGLLAWIEAHGSDHRFAPVPYPSTVREHQE